MTQFYEIRYDPVNYPDRWHLDDPIDEFNAVMDANMLPKRGPYIGPRISKVQIDTRYPGRPLDFSFGYFDFILLRTHVADLIESHGGRIQRFPVTLDPTGEAGYEVIFTLDAPKGLIDLSRAEEYEFFEADDPRVEMRYGGIPPRQRGMLYKIYDLYLDPHKAESMEFFRPWEHASLIVSESLKNAFEAAAVTGIKYRLVT